MRVQAHLPGQLPDSVTACCRSVPSCTSILFAPLLKVPQPWWCAHQTAQLPITARPTPNDFSRRINTPCYHQRPANSSRTRSVETEETKTTNTVLRNSSSVFLVQNETMLAPPHPPLLASHPQAAAARHSCLKLSSRLQILREGDPWKAIQLTTPRGQHPPATTSLTYAHTDVQTIRCCATTTLLTPRRSVKHGSVSRTALRQQRSNGKLLRAAGAPIRLDGSSRYDQAHVGDKRRCRSRARRGRTKASRRRPGDLERVREPAPTLHHQPTPENGVQCDTSFASPPSKCSFFSIAILAIACHGRSQRWFT